MARGRKTNVRNNIIELLFYLKEAYGYELYHHYIQLFPKVSRRLIYYHLARGVQEEELVPLGTRKEEGNYSWGSSVEKLYYKLGPNARPRQDIRIERYVEDMISAAYEERRKNASSVTEK